jgi:hypothetical protein
MPTPDPFISGARRDFRGLRGITGAARRVTSTAGAGFGLAVVLASLVVASVACTRPAAEVDVEAREAERSARLANASQVAAASLPEGAMEVARLGYVKEGIPASLAAAPLSNTFASIEELARAVLDGIESNQGTDLWQLALTEGEFREVVWPVLPASRPERNTPFDYTWGTLEFKSSNALSTSLAKYRGHHYELLGVEFVAHAQRQRDYGAFRVHRDARVRVRKEDGSEDLLDLFGSVIERGGRFKVFSYVTD